MYKNSSMIIALWLTSLGLIAGFVSPQSTYAAVPVWTYHYDNARTGANLAETVLTTANVNQASFGKLLNIPVDGLIFAQPLYLPNLTIGGVTHNVLYVVTASNSLYALDADNGVVLWRKNYGTPPLFGDSETCLHPTDPSPAGIIGTPVIDTATGTIYFVQRNKNPDGTYHQWIRAADILTGLDKFNSPSEITATAGGVTFDPLFENQRTALTLANGVVYAGWGSTGDCGEYHGWVMGFQASNVANHLSSFVDTTAAGGKGGIWMSGAGLTVDPAGNLYLMTGNGLYDGVTFSGGTNFGDSMLKLNGSLSLSGHFTPSNQDVMAAHDEDLGSAGVVAIPGTTFVAGGGKDGILDLVDTGVMGGSSPPYNQAHQWFQAANIIHNSPVYSNLPGNLLLYIWGENDFGKSYAFDGQAFAVNPSSTTALKSLDGCSGALCLSANGTVSGSGILWANIANSSTDNGLAAGTLHAYDANNLANELWNSDQIPARDAYGVYAKFCPPVVVNGKVYMITFAGQVTVFGLLDHAAPSNLTATPGPSQTLLSWSSTSGAVSYNVFRSTTSGAEGATPIASGITGTSYTDTGVTNEITYYYTVSAVKSAFITSQSPEVSVVSGTQLITDNLNDWSVIYSKTANWLIDNSKSTEYFAGDQARAKRLIDDSEYLIYRFNNIIGFKARIFVYSDFLGAATISSSVDNGVSYQPIPLFNGYETPSVPIHFDNDYWRYFDVIPAGVLPPGVTHLKVQFDPDTSAAWEPQLAQITIGYGGGPAGLAATAGNSQVALTWTAMTGETSYNIKRSTTSGGPYTTVATPTTASFTDTSLGNGTTYYYVVSATNGAGETNNSSQVAAIPINSDAPPTIATAAHATPNPVASTSAALSVLGADDGGEGPLTYTWAVTAKPASVAAPTFSVNGTNAAKNTTATFKGTGSYTFTVTIKEPSGLTTTSSVNVMVNQTISFITLTPASANIGPGTTQQFTAVAKDLFGVTMTTQPTFTWTATGGTVNSSGLYTAGPTNGTFQVTVTGGGKTQHATVTISGAVQVLTSITVAPASASISNGGTQQFTATAFDQNNSPMSPQPAITWTVSGGGTINASGLFSATTIGGPYTVTASSGSVSGTASVTVTDPTLDTPPTVATPAAANPNPVTSSTTALSVLGADDGGEAPLTYTWVATVIPSGTVSPTFSANGTNAAKNTVAAFKKAGSYTFTVTIKEPSNQTVTSSVNVTVNQTLSFITVTPTPVTVLHGTTQQFTATAKDLFGNVMAVQPTFTWTATGGTVTTGGLYTAGATTGSAFAVTATAGGKSGKATVTVN